MTNDERKRDENDIRQARRAADAVMMMLLAGFLLALCGIVLLAAHLAGSWAQ